jgi:hypothetical protein
MPDPIQIGTRVRLKPYHNWLSKWQRLADSKRAGTVVGLHPQIVVKFDMIRPGAKPIQSNFLATDLDIIPGSAPAEQEPLTSGWPHPDEFWP